MKNVMTSQQRMTGRQRLLAALRGEPVDRPPIWLREGFNIGADPMGEPMEDVLGAGGGQELLIGWKRDPAYQELFSFVSPHVEVMRSWGTGGVINRFLMIPPEHIHREERQIDHDTIHVDGRVDTPKGPLKFRDEIRRGINTYWQVEPLVRSVEDLDKLASVPFQLDGQALSRHVGQFREAHRRLGDRGLMRLEYPSPIVAISATMELQSFLYLSAAERGLYHQLLEEITRRLLEVTDVLFGGGRLDTIVNLGGSEQCTPPLMAPDAFDEYVVPYDGQIIRRLKEYGVLVNMHCHGRVCHALKGMVQMGVDSTDPVEIPPGGDVTMREARELTQGRLTLIGNLEFDELERGSEEHIRRRVREILAAGTRRLVVGASAGPISAVTPQLARNYRAWIETVLETQEVS